MVTRKVLSIIHQTVAGPGEYILRFEIKTTDHTSSNEASSSSNASDCEVRNCAETWKGKGTTYCRARLALYKEPGRAPVHLRKVRPWVCVIRAISLQGKKRAVACCPDCPRTRASIDCEDERKTTVAKTAAAGGFLTPAGPVPKKGAHELAGSRRAGNEATSAAYFAGAGVSSTNRKEDTPGCYCLRCLLCPKGA